MVFIFQKTEYLEGPVIVAVLNVVNMVTYPGIVLRVVVEVVVVVRVINVVKKATCPEIALGVVVVAAAVVVVVPVLSVVKKATYPETVLRVVADNVVVAVPVVHVITVVRQGTCPGIVQTTEVVLHGQDKEVVCNLFTSILWPTTNHSLFTMHMITMYNQA